MFFCQQRLKFWNFSTGQYETFHMVEPGIQNTGSEDTLLMDHINLLYTKDRFGISNQAYHELSMVCKEMPRSCKVKERIKEINKKWNLSQTPGETVGVQQNIKCQLETRVKQLIESSQLTDHDKLRVKLSGDGTNVGKNLHAINITLTILEEGAQAMAAEGNHLVAVIKVPEDYDHLFVVLGDIRREVENLTQVSVGEKLFQIEWFLGGDWKFLACVCGLGAAHATRPCIWCKCPLYDHFDVKK